VTLVKRSRGRLKLYFDPARRSLAAEQFLSVGEHGAGARTKMDNYESSHGSRLAGVPIQLRLLYGQDHFADILALLNISVRGSSFH
jgi:hypothetical protein